MPKPVGSPQVQETEESNGGTKKLTNGNVVTVNGLVKTLGVAVTIVSIVVSLVWFAADQKSQLITLQEQQSAFKHDVEEHERQTEKDLDRLRDHIDKTDQTVADLNRKLDVAVTILERIDKKVGAN